MNENEEFNNLDGDPGDYSNIFGLGKKDKERKAAKAAESASASTTATSDAPKTSTITKASNTLKKVNESGLLSQVGDFFGSLKKKKSDGSDQGAVAEQGAAAPLEVKKDNTMLYVGLGLGAVVLIGGGIYLATRK